MTSKTTSYRTHSCNDTTIINIDNNITLCGWVHSRRDHGGLIFIDLRDRYGLTQIVFDPEHNKDTHKNAEHLRSEWVIQVTGKVRKRPEGQTNKNLNTGEIEILVDTLVIHNESKTLPFEIDEHAAIPNEELRLEYRYLDLRRKKMLNNLMLRHKMVSWTRSYFEKEDFIDVETPMMVKGTPEGSREYIIPSRVHPGEFYVLPQSPQQMKQLLMLAGFDKYFQLARCFRDEDLRGDRQPEFTQLDVEMSFVGMEDVMTIFENWAKGISETLAPQKKIRHQTFPRLKYMDAINMYGTDKPDIRYDLTIQDADEVFKGSGINFMENVLNSGGVIKALRVPNGSDLPRSQIDSYIELVQSQGAGGMAYMIFDKETGELKGTLAKFFEGEKATRAKEQLGAEKGDIVFFMADKWEKACTYLGVLRTELGNYYKLKDNETLAWLWITDFPLFEKGDDGTIGAVHHPFTRPNAEDMHLLESEETKLQALSETYDIVLNGYEMGGGSVRIHEQELQKKVFALLNISEKDQERRFGHILKAFQYGVPPHAGIAIGFDRLAMIFADESNIREVTAFPKTQKARDLMFGSPTALPETTLKEAHINIRN